MNQHVKDDGDLRRYYSQIPHLADDELDPYEMRLYVHYKRVCGQGGECNEITETTATKTKMSERKVRSTRQSLADKGWLRLEKAGPRGHERVHVTLTDRWNDNYVRYSNEATSTPAPDAALDVVPLHQVHPVPLHQVQPKEEPIRQEKEKTVSSGNGKARDPLFDVIADNWHTAPGQTALLKSLMLGTNKKHIDCNFSPPAAPDEVAAFVEWYGRKYPKINLPVAPEKLQSHFYAFRKSPSTSRRPETRWNPVTKTNEEKVGDTWYAITSQRPA